MIPTMSSPVPHDLWAESEVFTCDGAVQLDAVGVSQGHNTEVPICLLE